MSKLVLDFNGQELAAWTAEVDDRIGYKLGTIKKGWISSSLGDAVALSVNINISPNTVVEYFDGNKIVSLTLLVPEIPFLFTSSIHGDSDTGIMYCDTSGNLGFTLLADNHVMPVGDYIILAKALDRYTGQFGTTFSYKPAMQTNNFLSKYGTYKILNPNVIPAVNFDDFGGPTDGLTDISDQAYRMTYASDAIEDANEKPYALFKDGRYVFDGIRDNRLENLKVKGESEAGTIFCSNDVLTPTVRVQNIGHAENVTFQEIKTIQFFDTYLDNVTYKTIKSDANMYLCACKGKNTHIRKVTLDFSSGIYIGIEVDGWTNLSIEDSVFNPFMTGTSFHCIRIDPPKTKIHSISIKRNEVYKGITGIFLAGGRSMPTVGALVEDNIVKYQSEESIAMDGYGNNYQLCPTICNGALTAADNTGADGRLKLTADMVYTTDGLNPSVSTISLRDDWTNFYYSFDDGSGLEGTVIPIYDYDSANNTVTLDVLTLASSVTIGGSVGIQSGFFNCSIKRNKVTGSQGLIPYNTDYEGRGISAYLNIFNCSIEDNEIVSCSSGIILLGGLMLGVYKMLTYGNMIRNNKITGCNTFDSLHGALALKTISNTHYQYGNQVLENTVTDGLKIEIHDQKDFKYVAGNIDSPPVEYRYCGNPRPTASESNVGQDFFEIIDDASGVPTSMKRLTCMFDGTDYLWL